VKFFGVDFPTVILVEHPEGSFEVVLTQESLSAHSGGQELGVVNSAAVVRVRCLQYLQQFSRIFSLSKALLQLFKVDVSVTVAI